MAAEAVQAVGQRATVIAQMLRRAGDQPEAGTVAKRLSSMVSSVNSGATW
jgi:hypothetical protein